MPLKNTLIPLTLFQHGTLNSDDAAFMVLAFDYVKKHPRLKKKKRFQMQIFCISVVEVNQTVKCKKQRRKIKKNQ